MMVEMTLGTVGTIIQKALLLLGRWYISKGVWFNGTGSWASKWCPKRLDHTSTLV